MLCAVLRVDGTLMSVYGPYNTREEMGKEVDTLLFKQALTAKYGKWSLDYLEMGRPTCLAERSSWPPLRCKLPLGHTGLHAEQWE